MRGSRIQSVSKPARSIARAAVTILVGEACSPKCGSKTPYRFWCATLLCPPCPGYHRRHHQVPSVPVDELGQQDGQILMIRLVVLHAGLSDELLRRPGTLVEGGCVVLGRHHVVLDTGQKQGAGADVGDDVKR